MIRPHARRRTARFLAATLAASFLSMGIPAPASAAEPPPAPTDLRVELTGGSTPGVACGAERVWTGTASGLSLSATTTFPDAATGQTSVMVHTRLFRAGELIHGTSWVATIGRTGLFLPPDALVTDGEYTVQISASDTTPGSPEGPVAECLIGVRNPPVSAPAVRPVYGADVVYFGAQPRGGVGVPGLFAIYSDPTYGQAPYEDVVEYEYAVTSSTALPATWSTTAKTGDTTFLEVSPTASGWQYLHVRNRDSSGLTGNTATWGFLVAASQAEAVATPAPVTVGMNQDSDHTDGKLPLHVIAGEDLISTFGNLRWTGSEVTLVRGDVELLRMSLDERQHWVDIPVDLLGRGPQTVSVTYQMMPGGPVWATQQEMCATGCSFATDGIAFDDEVVSGLPVGWSAEVYPGPDRMSYQWYLDGAPIQGATAYEYTPASQDEGKALTLAVTYERVGYETLRLETTPAVVGPGLVPDVLVSAHAESLGWLDPTSDGGAAGTVGQGLRLEALALELVDQPVPGYIVPAAHVQNLGWQTSWLEAWDGGGIIGTEGRGLRLEAIRLSLGGELTQYYDLYYRVHAQNFGWLGWAKNGEDSGTAGYAYRLEAVQVKLVPKTQAAPSGNGAPAFQESAESASRRISVSAHVQNVGWMAPVAGGQTAGTEGRGLRVEALRFGVAGDVPGGIEASAHVQNIGWQPFAGTGGLVGTAGQSLRVEAFRIRLTGQLAEKYDVYYRTHAQNFGWLGWAKNGEDSGTAGYAYRLEAVQVMLVPKGGPAPSGTGLAFHQQG